MDHLMLHDEQSQVGCFFSTGGQLFCEMNLFGQLDNYIDWSTPGPSNSGNKLVNFMKRPILFFTFHCYRVGGGTQYIP